MHQIKDGSISASLCYLNCIMWCKQSFKAKSTCQMIKGRNFILIELMSGDLWTNFIAISFGNINLFLFKKIQCICLKQE